MASSLVIVESPAKAKTIKKYLGRGFEVKASIGHVKDLPEKELGVDIEHDFSPTYTIIHGKKKIISELKEASRKVDQVLLAPDPDREGEAIAWHIAEEIRRVNKNIKRVLFNEITQKGVTQAIAHPQPLDPNKYNSQQARRILDRLVGYQISPILWEKVRRGLSAGRVQSVTLRLIAEREQEIEAFRPREYWTIEATLTDGKDSFKAKLFEIDGKKSAIHSESEAKKILEDLKRESFRISKVITKERLRRPAPPLITSTLQQEGAKQFHFTAKRTMMIAQHLYEGLDLGEFGTQGLITYMRTDSVRLSDEAIQGARAFVASHYGKEYLPDTPPVYKSRKTAQEAHEAIRPTSVELHPDLLKPFLSPEEIKIYRLIWNRYIACQMMPARFHQTSVDLMAGPRFLFRATGSQLLFPGFLAAFGEVAAEEQEPGEEGEEATTQRLPHLEPETSVRTKEIEPQQHFTQPPPRFAESSLIKELEDKGIGRPSTYASIMTTIQNKAYVRKVDGKFSPTELGKMIVGLLVENFPRILDVEFTANMELDLDEIEAGHQNWVDTLRTFYDTFEPALSHARTHMRDVKREQIATEHPCSVCGNVMVIKWGKMGEFLACSTYPACTNTKEFRRDESGKIVIVEAEETGEKCEKCGSAMVIKRGRFGRFLACSSYPECKSTRALSIGISCPLPGCGGALVERRTKKGKIFYGCGNYPKCTFALWNRPMPQPCPLCNYPFLVQKVSKSGAKLACPNPDCKYSEAQEAANE